MKKYALYILTIAGFLITEIAQAQWSVASLSQARHDAFPLVVGQKVLFIGGQADGGVESNVVDIYDYNTNSWSMHLLPQGTQNLGGNASVAVGDIAVVVAGLKVSLYNASTDKWSEVQWANPRTFVSGAVVGKYIVLAGGYFAGTYLDIVDIFDTTTGLWSTAQLSEPRALVAMSSLGNRLFIAGGLKSGNVKSDRVDIFDVENNTWSTATLSYPRGMITAITVGDKVVFAGGGEFDYVFYNQVDIYDDATGTWSNTTLQQDAWAGRFRGLVVGGKAYFGDGVDEFSNPSNIFDVYDPVSNTWSKVEFPTGHVLFSVTGQGPNIFVAGGVNNPGKARVDQYNTQTGTWTLVGILDLPRYYMAAATLNDKVFFAGGLSNTSRVDIYTDPNWTAAPIPDKIAPVKIYPNPASGSLNIQSPVPIKRFAIMDQTGRLLLEQFNPGGDPITINLSSHAPGMYLLHLETETSRSVKKVVLY